MLSRPIIAPSSCFLIKFMTKKPQTHKMLFANNTGLTQQCWLKIWLFFSRNLHTFVIQSANLDTCNQAILVSLIYIKMAFHVTNSIRTITNSFGWLRLFLFFFVNVCFQKISIPPHGWSFSFNPPTPLEFPFQRVCGGPPHPLGFSSFFLSLFFKP